MTLIGHYLPRHDLAACVCVSQDWLTLFNPHLWHTLAYQPPSRSTTPATAIYNRHINNSIARGVCTKRETIWQFRVLDCIEAGALKRSGYLIRVLDVWVLGILSALVSSPLSQSTSGGETVTGLQEFVVPCRDDYKHPAAVDGKVLQEIDAERQAYLDSPSTLGDIGSWHPLQHHRQQQHPWEHKPHRLHVRMYEMREAVATILRRNPNLRCVTANGIFLVHKEGGEQQVSEEIWDAIPSKLEYLAVQQGWNLTYRTNSTDNIAPAAAVAAPPPESYNPLSPLPSLKRLDISHSYLSYSALSRILKSCPALETLCLIKVHGVSTKELASLIRTHCPNLTSLVLLQWTPYSDEAVADLINSSVRGWKTLGFPIRHHDKMLFGPLSTEALLKHSVTLENLRMEGHEGFSSAAVHELFCSAPKLRRFAGVARDRFYGRDVKLDAGLDIWMSSKEWVCLNLESLKVQICGVSRPDLVSRTNGRPLRVHQQQQQQPLLSVEAAFQHSQEVQTKVYNQLGRLTRLQELVLGKDDVDLLEEVTMAEQYTEGEYYDSGGEEDNGVQMGFQYECLEMSLRSGLGRMCGLKELRSLKIEAMATRFRKEEEQAWVKAQWPRFLGRRRSSDEEEEEKGERGKKEERYVDRFWMEYGLPEYL